jgi:hypothetical protein
MGKLGPLAWIVGSATFVLFLGWIGVRMIRWAKKRSNSTDLLGLGISLPAAGISPQPLPQEQIEEVTNDIQRRKDTGGADPVD